ncbi:MAG: dihydroorotate dehydrogenase electron transfer subunit [Candidatus Norongarragalinales archaeon]
MKKKVDVATTITKENFAFVEIAGIEEENSKVKTLRFQAKLDAEPGQFVMLWLPGVDAKPFGVMSQNNNDFAVTVARVGAFTEKLFALKKSDCIGVQGAFGKPFEIPAKAKRVACVAGGFGAAPLAFLAQRCAERGVRVVFFEGAKTQNDVILEKRLRSLGCDFRLATDDGSLGFKGFCTELFAKALKKEKFDAAFTCGPEKMMAAVVKICKSRRLPLQFSLERFMKCGYGVCGNCACGSRLACIDGPVFSPRDLLELSDFGKARRDASGAVVPL